MAVDVLNMREEDINALLGKRAVRVPAHRGAHLRPGVADFAGRGPLGWPAPCWTRWRAAAGEMRRVRDHALLGAALRALDYTEDAAVTDIRLSEGAVDYRLALRDGLFYQVLGEACGQEIKDEEHLFELMKVLVQAKREYDRVAGALESVRSTGYGLVTPSMEELTLEEPEIVRQGSRFGVRLKASAPSLHMIRVDIDTEVNPIVGTEKQSEELVKYLLSGFENDRAGIWDYGDLRQIPQRPGARRAGQQAHAHARGCAHEIAGSAQKDHQRGHGRHDLHPALRPKNHAPAPRGSAFVCPFYRKGCARRRF